MCLYQNNFYDYRLKFLLGILFFQAEDGIRDPEMSRGLGDVYKRQDESDIDKINIKKNITGKKINSIEVLVRVASDNQTQK